MQTRILVDHMPKTPSECPFALFSNDTMPAVCQLKLPAHIFSDGVVFGHERTTNCDCDKCPNLKEQ